MSIILPLIWYLFVLIQIAQSAWSMFVSLLNSQIGLTLIGTMVAAFAGVVGAHFITQRFRRKEQLLKELRITNASISLSFEICNSMLNLKDQNLKEIVDTYRRVEFAHGIFEVRKQAGLTTPNEEFTFVKDFRMLSPMREPGDILQKHIFESISPNPRVLQFAGTLLRSIDSLNQVLRQRTELIETEKKKPQPQDQEQLKMFYLGLTNRHGYKDESFLDGINAMSTYNDNCIQFSKMLCEDLVIHGEKIRKQLGRKALSVTTFNFNKAVENGLMPDESEFQDFINMIVLHKEKTWKRKLTSIFSSVSPYGDRT